MKTAAVACALLCLVLAASQASANRNFPITGDASAAATAPHEPAGLSDQELLFHLSRRLFQDQSPGPECGRGCSKDSDCGSKEDVDCSQCRDSKCSEPLSPECGKSCSKDSDCGDANNPDLDCTTCSGGKCSAD